MGTKGRNAAWRAGQVQVPDRAREGEEGDSGVMAEEEYNDFDDYEDEDDVYCETCGNLGTILCECGGDICVCENNGEIPCPECG